MDRKTLWVGLSLFLLLGIVVALYIIFTTPASFRGTTYVEPFPAAADFSITRADGSVFQMAEQKGHITLLFFGFTNCPDVCPTTLAELNQAMAQLGGSSEQIQVVLITVDPARDTPEKIQQYVAQFNPSFIGLSGSQPELEKIWADYGVYREIVGDPASDDYDVEHTARITLVDADGNLRLSYGTDVPVEDIVHDLKLLLP
jgi:protein SCO1/2